MLRIAYWLNLRRIRQRPLRALLAVLSVAAGVSLGVSVVVMTSSVSASLHSFSRQLAGPAPLRIVGATSDGGIAEDVLPAVEHTPGVSAVVPMVQVVTYAGTATNPQAKTIVALGVDCRVQALLGRFGCTSADIAALADSEAASVSRRLAGQLGARASIQTDVGPVPILPGSGLATLDSFNRGAVAVFALPEAQRLFDRSRRLDVIYVVADHGTDLTVLRSRLQAAVGPSNGVLTATDPPPAVGVYTGTIVPLFALLSLFALAVGGVLIFNIMALAMEERRRELAIVAALGGTIRVLRAGALLEGVFLGLVGGLFGVVGGTLLARPLTSSLSSFTVPVVGVRIPVHLTAGAVVTGLALGAVVGGLAALLPTRRAGRIDVVAELSMREAAAETQPGRYALTATAFTVLCAAGMAICWVAQRHGALHPWQAAAAPAGALVATVGYLLAAGALAAVLATALAHRLHRLDGPVRLGVSNLARQGRRAGVMAVAVGAAVTTSFVIGSVHASAVAAIASSIETGHPQEVYVSTLGPNNTVNIEDRPTTALAARLSRIPGVAHVDREVFLLSGHDSHDLVGVGAGTYPWLNNPMIEGSKSLASFDSGRVLVGAALARSRDLRPGSTLWLDTPTGRASVVVGGVWQDGNMAGRAVTMPMSLFQRLFGNQPPQSLGLIPVPGVSTTELANRVRAAHILPGLIVENPAQFTKDISASVDDELAPFTAMQRALLLVAFVAVLSTLLLVGVQRRRELGLLAAVGMEPAQLAGMTVAEGVGAGLIGLALAFVGSIVIATAFNLVLPIVIGFKDPLRFDFGNFAMWAAVSLALVTTAALLPAWRNARVPILESLQYE